MAIWRLHWVKTKISVLYVRVLLLLFRFWILLFQKLKSYTGERGGVCVFVHIFINKISFIFVSHSIGIGIHLSCLPRNLHAIPFFSPISKPIWTSFYTRVSIACIWFVYSAFWFFDRIVFRPYSYSYSNAERHSLRLYWVREKKWF